MFLSRSGRALLAGLLVLLGIVAVGFFLARRPPGAEGARERFSTARGGPFNVVLITVDTLRADRLGSYGSQRTATPHMDALAAEGARFSNAASTVPFTLPAHSSLMTGTYPPYHGVRENVGYRLGSDLPTLAEALSAGGWTTAGFVSAFVLDSRWGIARGFATYVDDFDATETRSGNLGAVQRDGAETVSEALRWLDGRPPGPVFVWLHLFEPHDPYTPPEPYLSRYAGRPYDGEVAYADELVGRFRTGLEEREILDRSLVILTGDHGEGLGQHKEGFHGFFVYDSTVHVPLIVRPPFPDLAGKVVAEPVSHVDLLPTILEIAGLPVPAHAQGRSLWPLLEDARDGGAEDGEEAAVYSESMYPLVHYGWAPLRSLRTGTWKLIDAPRPELYDLAADPGERENVVLQERRLYRRLKGRLDALVERIESPADGQGGRADVDEESVRQLEALGYLAGRGGVSIAAEGDVERADPKDRIDLHQQVMTARSELGEGDPGAARERLEAVLESDSSMVDAHQMLGTIAMQEERFELAASHFQNALAVKDDHLEALFGLANAYRKIGRREEALVGFERLLALEPGNSRAAAAASELLTAAGRPSEATGVLEKAIAGDDPPAILLNQLAELRSLAGDAGAAAELFERALAANEDLVVARFNLAVLREETGRIDEAIDLYEEVLARAPRHFQAQFNLGRIYGQRGQRGDDARQRQLWQASIDSNPGFARGHFLLAKLLMDEGGDLRRAEELVRAGLERDAEHRSGPLGHYVLADILNRTGRNGEAARAVATGRRIEAEQRGGAP